MTRGRLLYSGYSPDREFDAIVIPNEKIMKKAFAAVAFYGVLGLLLSQASIWAQRAPSAQGPSAAVGVQNNARATNADTALQKFVLDYY